MATNVTQLLGKDAESLLGHQCKTIDKSMLQLPGAGFIDNKYQSKETAIRSITVYAEKGEKAMACTPGGGCC